MLKFFKIKKQYTPPLARRIKGRVIGLSCEFVFFLNGDSMGGMNKKFQGDLCPIFTYSQTLSFTLEIYVYVVNRWRLTGV